MQVPDDASPKGANVEKAIGVVGGGIMGCGIAEVAARSGCDVVLREINEDLVEAAKRKLDGSLDTAVRKGKLTEKERDDIKQRVRFTDKLEELVRLRSGGGSGGRGLGCEERDLRGTGQDRPAGCAYHQQYVVHPYHAAGRRHGPAGTRCRPALLQPGTGDAAGRNHSVRAFVGRNRKRAPREFAADQLGKTTITAKDRAGFVVNALLIPYLLAAIRMADAGLASAEDIDKAMVGGCNHPMGPLALTDLIGLDTTVAVAESMYAETKEQLYAPPALLLRKVEAGELGRKSGRGFFSYSKASR